MYQATYQNHKSGQVYNLTFSSLRDFIFQVSLDEATHNRDFLISLVYIPK